ncbi:uncharacterized protein [Musca autumnalis]|uniref:uncharacterized protein n=1 Tax=Musca autumnalis TaxID=221902 RepID=UPI003CEA9151
MKPHKFETPEKKQKSEENVLMEAEVKLEMGNIKCESVSDRGVVNASHGSQIIEQEDALQTERVFVHLSTQLTECLGRKRADVDRCLDIMKQYKELKVTKLMLLSNPDCVDNIRLMRRYVGNLKLWKLSVEEEAEFKAKAEIIRSEAAMIYNNFKKMCVPSILPTIFWEKFCNPAQHMQKYKTNNQIEQTEDIDKSVNVEEKSRNTAVEAD